MKKSTLLFTVLLMAAYGQAQITHRDLLAKFSSRQLSAALLPTAQFRPFPQTPNDWKKLLPDSLIQQLIHGGESALKKEFKNIPATVMLEFVRTGNRTEFENLSFGKRVELWNLVLAESVEGNGRFVDHIVDGIWSICEESFWGVSAHLWAQKAGAGLPDVEDPTVDLFAAETAAVLAWTDYFIGPQLEKVSKLVRPRIRYEIGRRILQPMVTRQFGWEGSGNPEAKLNNWAPWIISNYLTAVLLIVDKEDERMADVERGIKVIDQYINGLGADGGCEEGPTYWAGAAGCVYDALNLLFDATGGKLTIYQDAFIQKMGAYIYKTHIAGKYFINVADAHPEFVPDGLMLFRFGKDMNDPVMMQFGSWSWHVLAEKKVTMEIFHRTRSLYNFTALGACAAYPAKEEAVPQVWLSDVQLMAARSANGLFVASHGGNNGESHNHNDVGDFMVYAKGYPLIVDVGSGTYTARTFSKDRYSLWFLTSPYHNLPTIKGVEQGAESKFAASDVKYADGRLSMDIAGAYPAGAGVTSWQRTVGFSKDKTVEVDDHYKGTTSFSDITQTFMTVCPTDIGHAGRILFTLPDGSQAYLDYDLKVWTARKEKIALTTPEDQGLKTSWEGRDIWRILLTGQGEGKEVETKYFIHE
ncbi:MAG TPA: heparinase II/III family protein [Puia sp.]|nr:heparinase II/III family protein [Puia sp.]